MVQVDAADPSITYILIENVFAGKYPPNGAQTFELTFMSMVNPYSVKPAGDVKIRSYWTDTVLGRGPFLMDQG